MSYRMTIDVLWDVLTESRPPRAKLSTAGPLVQTLHLVDLAHTEQAPSCKVRPPRADSSLG